MTTELTPEQWLAEQADGIEADSVADEREAIDAIVRLEGIREAKRLVDADEKKIRAPIDNWFRTHPGEPELLDHERGLKVFLRSGGMSEVYDLPSAIQARNPALYRRLEELGLFRLDGDATKKAIADGLIDKSDIAPFMAYRERSPALMVGKVK